MLHAEALAGPEHRRERHAGGLRPVEELGPVAAEVAVVAGLGEALAEVAEQHLAPAVLGLGKAEERVQPLVVGLLALDRRRTFVDLGAAQPDVVGAVERQGVGGRAVAARPADLLVVALDRLRQVGVGDVADVGLVDAHAEGDGRADDEPVLPLEAGLAAAALVGVEPGVVGERRVAGLPQREAERLGLGAGGAVDDPGLAAAGADVAEDLPARVVLGLEGERQVRPVEAAQEGLGPPGAEQPGDDLGAGLGVGGGGERHRLDAAEAGAQRADPEVVRAEVVAPLAHAMRLVDGEKRGPDALQEHRGALGGEALRGHVEQLEPALVEGGEGLLGLLGVGLRGERPGGDAGGAERPDLVAHQRDQRRDDEGDARPGQRRQLVAERLAAAGRHDREHVAPGLDRGDDLLLAGTEVGEAEDLPEQAARLGHGSKAGSGTVERKIAIMVSP